MSFIGHELSDDLLPFSGKLSERFYEVRQNVAEFCTGARHTPPKTFLCGQRALPAVHT
jgi:hypothetical protein